MSKIIILKLFVLLIILGGCASPATKSFNKGKIKYEQGEYQPAIENFRQALDKGAAPGPTNYYIAESYRRSNRIQEAEAYYSGAIAAKTTEEDAYFWYGYSLKSAGKYEAASSQFEDYLKIGTNFDYINRAKNEIENLRIITDIINKKSFFRLEDVKELNTPASEYSPVMQDQKLYYTTSQGSEKTYLADGTGFTDIYEYVFDGITKFSGQAKRLSDFINTVDAHEATPTFSKDGNTIIFSRSNTGSKKGSQDCDLFQSTKVAGEWTEPVMLNISDPNSWDSSPWLTSDGRTLYFSSNREGGNGGTDLYKATKDASGAWGNVTNLGTPINTRGNEQFPTISKENKLYFSSDGHPSLGGLDLFVVKKENGKTSVENLGRPMNTSDDDFGIFFRDTVSGYMSSNRPDGKGDDDIYEFFDESKIIHVHYFIDGSIFGKKKPPSEEYLLANATIKIVNSKGDTIATVLSDTAGRFKYEVDPESNYKLVAKKDGYATVEADFTTIGKKVAKEKLHPGENDVNLGVKIVLPFLENENVFVVDNIYYDFNDSRIRPDAAIELYKIVEFLRNNPEIKIELGSHTDSRGSAQYNRVLAQKRAQSAVNYIISKGIDKDRITGKGYGEDKPLSYSDTLSKSKIVLKEAYILSLKSKEAQEAAHQKNRRTEITITNVGSNTNVQIKKKGGSGDDESLKIKREGE
jgi:peptidoglycan-associated lipoprotein